MHELTETNKIVEKAALTLLTRAKLSKVLSEPTLDSQGKDALQVTIVLRNGNLDGDIALDTIVGIERALRNSGDERFPIVDFVTEDEMTSHADIES